MIKKILIANRGEIAIRVMRTCREMGIASVAVYSEADKDALFVKYADEAYLLGPSPASQSYLDIQRVMQKARESRVDAIHPGYGFLAENPEFAAACEREGIKFIGPPARVLKLTGDKLAARRALKKAGIPVVPGTEESVRDFEHARSLARQIGYPVILKPSGGGGGIGMTIAENEAHLGAALDSTRAIALNTFAVGDLYIEKYLANPRHIEFQILADGRGNAIHLGERECSIQRRHQKLIEESPSPALTAEIRRAMGQTAVTAAQTVGYEGAGTVEFLYSNGSFYFLEVNARIQVEHPVTEMVTGIDIVKEQIRIAQGNSLALRQEAVSMRGNAIECRINAEDPLNDFLPAPGKILDYLPPGGPGIRVDGGIYRSCTIPPFYDPMIAKLIAWGMDRQAAITRMRRALHEYLIIGVKTNIPFHQAVMENPRFIKGEIDTCFIEQESSLMEDVKRMAESDARLQYKLPQLSTDKKRLAAMAAAAFVTGHREAEKRPK